MLKKTPKTKERGLDFLLLAPTTEAPYGGERPKKWTGMGKWFERETEVSKRGESGGNV